jgi:outer membrane lipoprotein LolB
MSVRGEPSHVAAAGREGLSSWRAVGRLAVKATSGGFNASFDWRQAGARGELSVHGPFGAGRSRVQIDPDRIRVESGDAAPLDFAPPFEGVERALLDRLGFEVPLGSLRYWLLGLADPLEPFDGGPGSGFTQHGWHVEVDDVDPASVPSALPRRLTLSRGDARIRVVFDRWETVE